MYYGTIKKTDIANGLGVRVSLFVSGCTNHCRECFQPETWDFCYGQPFTAETEELILTALAPSYINGLTLLGGEPFETENQRALLPFVRRVRAAFPDKDIWCYTGFTLDKDLLAESRVRCEATDALLALIDVLVDGRFEADKKDVSLKFRGSSNQRLIDLKRTLNEGKIILLDI